MSKKWFKCESKREMIGNNENNNKSFDSNNQIKPNGKSFDGRTQASAPHSEDPSRSPSNDTNGCKVCHNDDPSAQFFASGPFYAIEAMAHNIDSSGDSSAGRHRSDGCNVLYAEMPHIFNEQMSLRHNKTVDDQTESSDTNGTADDREWSQSSALNPHFGDNYQLFCYNCCSPLGVDEESHPNHKLYYISTNDSNREQEVDNRSSLSSPIMLKFCREESVQTLGDPTIDATDSQSDESQTPYTTVIKPKAVRPPIGVNLDEMSDQSNQALPTISFHGSATVLTDSDESAFTQIPRRRSNSEATHHYQSIDRNGNHMPSNSHSHSRPHQRQHQRSKSVNKNFVDSKASFVKFGSMSDKHSTKTDTNVKGIYFARKDSRCDDLAQSNSPSEPIHMTLEEVKNIFSKSQNKSLRSVLKSRISNESEDKNPLNKCKSKSKLKVALENIFRHKRRSDLNRHSYEIDSKKCQNVVDNATNNQGTDSSSPFAHRALPPLPNKPATDESIESIDTNKTDICEELSLSKEEEEKRQKFLDYAASIERVKDCGWYWGPISGEMAEKLLASEPCGSFIVRDSSDEHYIFSLTFKLNGMVRHVRIEHDQGNFSFGSLQKFRSNTIVDFIENAVEHSRSGRFLFFLHRRPVMGPMRVQLLHPVSRFKQIQSLQHMCRFVILKHVRRDLIEELPLPQMLKQYLNTPYYYSEELAQANKPTDESEQSLPPNASH